MCEFFRMLICPATFTLGKDSYLLLYNGSIIYHLVIIGLEFIWFTYAFDIWYSSLRSCQHVMKLFKTASRFEQSSFCLTWSSFCAPQLQLRPEPFAAVQPDSVAETLRTVDLAAVINWGGGADSEQTGQLRHLWGRGFTCTKWVQQQTHQQSWTQQQI